MMDKDQEEPASARWMPDRAQLLWTLGWCFFSLAAFYWLRNTFLFVVLLLPFGAAAIGLLISGFWRAWELRSRPVAALGTALLLPAALLSVPSMVRAAIWLHFLEDRPAYEEIRTAVARRLANEDGEWGNIQYRVDRSGGVTRVAFVTNPGIVDNWAAVIHDPTGAVMMAKGHHTAPPEVQELFGGDIVACWRLGGDYYSCSFS